ncbi:MAG: xanthine dehydrogenase small subunit, partial [Pseudomonadota bacterium]
ELITVESLVKDGQLHPVQRAMADCDGAQCGFCTPGFVMSLFAHHQASDAALPDRIDDVIAGNLCRCTGYGPIRDASVKAAERAGNGTAFGTPETVQQLDAITRSEMLSFEWFDTLAGVQKRYFAPRSVDELARVASAHPDAVFLAGATDIGLWVTKHHQVLETLISINDVAELKAMDEVDGWLEIGAGVRYSDAWDRLGRDYPDFGELVRRIGSVQVRNSGTIGGNIANGSPIGDTPPALIALDAELVLNRGGARRTVKLEDFFIDYGKQDRAPGEFVETVRVPLARDGEVFRTYKISKRFDQDISAVCGAFRLRCEGDEIVSARVAYGGMAATPKRAPACEAALTGQRWSIETFDAAADALAQDYAPITDMRASDAYRMASASNLVRRLGLEREPGTVVTRLLDMEPLDA